MKGVRCPNGMTFRGWPGVPDGAVWTSYPLLPVKMGSRGQLSRGPCEAAKAPAVQTQATEKPKEVGSKPVSPCFPSI